MVLIFFPAAEHFTKSLIKLRANN